LEFVQSLNAFTVSSLHWGPVIRYAFGDQLRIQVAEIDAQKIQTVEFLLFGTVIVLEYLSIITVAAINRQRAGNTPYLGSELNIIPTVNQ